MSIDSKYGELIGKLVKGLEVVVSELKAIRTVSLRIETNTSDLKSMLEDDTGDDGTGNGDYELEVDEAMTPKNPKKTWNKN